MFKFFSRRGRFAIFYSVLLTAFSAYVLLDTFVIPHGMTAVVTAEETSFEAQTSLPESTEILSNTQTEQVTTALTEATEYGFSGDSYTDENISISINYERVNDTQVYVADIKLKYVSYLKTAFAKDTFGRNVKEKTSETAENHGAVFAVNGDYCGFRDYGYVERNGILYRDTKREAYDDDALVVYSDGRFEIVDENSVDAQTLVDNGAVQIFSFGPSLINNGEITVGEYQEVGNAMSSNPRTAIGMVSPLHYIVVVSDGRTEESKGLSLYQLAGVMEDYGCTVAYNLDGGGSSTMWFNGRVINAPTTNGSEISERKVSDIVYI